MCIGTRIRGRATHWCLAVVGLLAGCGADEGFTESIQLEEQLSVLGEIGLDLNPGITPTDLTTFHSRAILESDPYQGLVEVMGIDIERAPYTPICDRLWMCDFERIEDHGDYRNVIVRLEILTEGKLGLSNPMDFVDVEKRRAWVEFDHRGRRIHWDLRVEDDWLDPTVILRYDALLREAGSPLRIYFNDAHYGQSAFLAAFTPQEKARFDRLSDIVLEPVEKPEK